MCEGREGYIYNRGTGGDQGRVGEVVWRKGMACSF